LVVKPIRQAPCCAQRSWMDFFSAILRFSNGNGHPALAGPPCLAKALATAGHRKVIRIRLRRAALFACRVVALAKPGVSAVNPNLNNKEDQLIDVEQYWRNKEAALGEKIIAKFNCKYLGGYPDIEGTLSGLIYFSESFFCFQSFYSPGFLASIFRSREPLKTEEEQFFCQPLETATFEFEQQSNSLWNKIFAPPEQIFAVRLANEKNQTAAAVCRFKAMRHDVKLIARMLYP
jgi:hypothetical protein